MNETIRRLLWNGFVETLDSLYLFLPPRQLGTFHAEVDCRMHAYLQYLDIQAVSCHNSYKCRCNLTGGWTDRFQVIERPWHFRHRSHAAGTKSRQLQHNVQNRNTSRSIVCSIGPQQIISVSDVSCKGGTPNLIDRRGGVTRSGIHPFLPDYLWLRSSG